MDIINCKGCGKEVLPTPYCSHCGSETGATEEQIQELWEDIIKGEKEKERQGIYEVLIGNEWTLCEPVDPMDEQAGFFRLLRDTIDGQLEAGTLLRAEICEEYESGNHWIMTRCLIDTE